MTDQFILESVAWEQYVEQMRILCAIPHDSVHAEHWRQVVETAREHWAIAWRNSKVPAATPRERIHADAPLFATVAA